MKMTSAQCEHTNLLELEGKWLMVGTSLQTQGGIAGVVQNYARAGVFEVMPYLATHCDGSMWKRMGVFGRAIAKYLFLLTTRPRLRWVHVHMASRGSFVRKSVIVVLARLFGRKALVHLHGAEFMEFYASANAPLRAWIRAFYNNWANHVVVLSCSWKQDLATITRNPGITVVHNPVALQPPMALAEHSLEPVFLFMGRIGMRKGTFDLIEAAAKVRADVPFRVKLFGDGDLVQAQTLIDRLNVGHRVQLSGWIRGNEKDAVYRASDVLVLPSYNEGLPMSVLEAMSYGLPVISTHVGGIPEAVADGETGLLHAPGDIQALTAALTTLAQDSALRVSMGRAAHQKAAREFDVPIIIDNLAHLWRKLLLPSPPKD